MKEYFTLLGKPQKEVKHYQLIDDDGTIIKEFDSNDTINNVLEKHCKEYSIDKIMHGKIFNTEDSIDIGVMLYKER